MSADPRNRQLNFCIDLEQRKVDVMPSIRIPMISLTSIVFSALIVTADASAAVVSTFDSGAEGWTGFQNVGGSVQHFTTVVTQTGTSAQLTTRLIGDTCRLHRRFWYPPVRQQTVIRPKDLQHEPWFSESLRGKVGLQGSGLTLISEAAIPTTNWSNYSFSLNATSGWRNFSRFRRTMTFLA